MRLADVFIGKSGRDVASLIKDTSVVGLVEVSTASEAPKKLEELKKLVSKPSSNGYLVIAFKA